MAANFWGSSHCNHWLLTRSVLQDSLSRQSKAISEEQVHQIHIFFATLLQNLGRQIKVRQRVVATSIVYFKRFYSKNTFDECDPMVVAPTCFYLASKIEEFALSVRAITKEMHALCPSLGLIEYHYRSEDLIEWEFYVLEELDCYLVVYHPYRPLTQYISDFQLQKYLQTSWFLVNDSYRTNVCLLYPPYIIAIAAMTMACLAHEETVPTTFKDILTKMHVDLDELAEVSQEMINLYRDWDNVDLSGIHEVLKKLTSRSRVPKKLEMPVVMSN